MTIQRRGGHDTDRSTHHHKRLDAYYVFIHPYLPILPPPTSIPVDQPVPRLQNQMSVYDDAASYEPTSPATLAISAILALIPCPAEAAPQAREAQLFRRKYAQYFAQSAFETIESDEEIPDSSIEPPRALSEEHNHPFRRPLHPRLPVHMERIVALCILSVYEYAQRGNLKKMQNRAGQAMMSAMDLMLHQCTVEDEFSEARRRVWWMSVSVPPPLPFPSRLGCPSSVGLTAVVVYLRCPRRYRQQYGENAHIRPRPRPLTSDGACGSN